jgi:CBS domain-containing protein
MIVVTLASIVGRALKEDSLYTLKLSRQGIALHRREDLIMRSHTVGEVMRPTSAVISDRTAISETVQYFLEHETFKAYVNNAQGQLVGTISIHDIKEPEVAELGRLAIARDVAESDFNSVAPGDTLAECMDQLVLSEDDELPVVDAENRLVGVVSRRDVLRVFSTELLRHEYLGVTSDDHGGGALRHAVRLTPGMTLARVSTPQWLVGRSLRDANLRAAYNLTAVAVQRAGKGEDHLPEPDVPLGGGDVLVVVGRPTDVERFRGLKRDTHASRSAP